MFQEVATTISSITSIVGATGGTSGLVKITAPAHGLSTGNKVIVNEVLGTTEANGYWTVTVIDAATLTLDSSTFANTYTSGGALYNGDVYSVSFSGAPSTAASVVANIKQINTSGAVVNVYTTRTLITDTSNHDFMVTDGAYAQAISSLTVSSNQAATDLTATIIVRETTGKGGSSYTIARATIPPKYSLVIGGDGVRSMYKDTGLPYVS